MASVNKVILIGNLGRDPEIRNMPSGDAMATLALATTETWKDKASGEKKEQTEWHRVVMFGKPAEIAGEYLRKGSQVYVEGSLRTRKYTDKDGVERYATEVKADKFEMLGSRQAGGDDQSSAPAQSPRSTGNQARGSAPAPRQPSAPGRRVPVGEDSMDEHIPF